MLKEILKIISVLFIIVCLIVVLFYFLLYLIALDLDRIPVKFFKGNTDSAKSVVESLFGVSIPESTEVFKIYQEAHEGMFYVFLEFNENDVNDFKSHGIIWFKVLEEIGKIHINEDFRSELDYSKVYYEIWSMYSLCAEFRKMVDRDSEVFKFFNSRTPPCKGGGFIRIAITEPENGKIRCYMEYNAMRDCYPVNLHNILPARTVWVLPMMKK